ncbi:MAG: NAD(P)(+) transhydrogenase (Re/Si-specific) subunit beta [Planctomycetes bacterium]|nr:NAD(P)(+) transhydrogenase (Re/Si-specific) subunit beta [Planctomycetota bacterium]
MTAAALIVAAILVGGILVGIRLMSSPRTAVAGNLLLAACVAGAIVATVVQAGAADVAQLRIPLVALAAGLLMGFLLAWRATMIRMPQIVALLNGLGGAASALVGAVVLIAVSSGTEAASQAMADRLIAALAVAIGAATLSGSLVASAKLHGLMTQRSVALPHNGTIGVLLLAAAAGMIVASGLVTDPATAAMPALLCVCLAFGVLFALRIGGADMPVAISLLNSLSGVAAAIAGFAVKDLLLVSVGAVVGAAGLILTQIMCRAMNRSLLAVISGIRPAPAATAAPTAEADPPRKSSVSAGAAEATALSAADLMNRAKNVVIIPGYGMALAQAQQAVKQLADRLERLGKQVAYAIHPVAGRMPGHMNVLLAEVDVSYDRLLDLDAANALLPQADLAIVVGANDVINPAAMTAVGTPIYGMPVLKACDARGLIICNFDRKPGYAGVPNSLYDLPATVLLLGDAKESVATLLQALGQTDLP